MTCNNITYFNHKTFYHLTFCLQTSAKPEIPVTFNNFKTKTSQKCESISTYFSTSLRSKNRSPPTTKATAQAAPTSFVTSMMKSVGTLTSFSRGAMSTSYKCYSRRTYPQTPMEHKYKKSYSYLRTIVRYKKCCRKSILMLWRTIIGCRWVDQVSRVIIHRRWEEMFRILMHFTVLILDHGVKISVRRWVSEGFKIVIT